MTSERLFNSFIHPRRYAPGIIAMTARVSSSFPVKPPHRVAYLEIRKMGPRGTWYISGVHFQKSSNISIFFTLNIRPSTRHFNPKGVGIQLSSWHGAAVFTKNHSACCWSNIAPSTAICIVIRSCGASNTSFIAWRPSFCGCWTTCMEQSTWVRHWLLHLQEISQD